MASKLIYCAMLATLAPSVGEAKDHSAKESWWRKVQEDSANAKGEWDGGTGDDGHMKRSHQHVTENCGHDIKVKFDWASFDINHWIDEQKKQQRPDDMAAGFCVYTTLYDIGDACSADSSLKSYQKDATKKIKTITCHARACKDMPDPNHRQSIATSAIYALSHDGANLDITYCENTSNEVTFDTFIRSL